MKDAILEEVWAVKDAIAKKYRYDPRKYMAALRRLEKKTTLKTGVPKGFRHKKRPA